MPHLSKMLITKSKDKNFTQIFVVKQDSRKKYLPKNDSILYLNQQETIIVVVLTINIILD